MPMICRIALLVVSMVAGSALGQTRFEVVIDEQVSDGAYSGRVYIALVPAGSGREPRQAMHAWFSPPPVFSVDVSGVGPGDIVALTPGGMAHPVDMDSIEPGEYDIQAIARVNPDSPKAGMGAGDLVSAVQTVTLDPAAGWTVRLTLDRVIEPAAFAETDRVKLLEMESPSLSAFLGRPRTIRAAVVLPRGYEERRGEKFPVVVMITGFGGNHRMALGLERSGMLNDPRAAEAIWVVPDPQCFRGHSVFADSANNGPWGEALVNELLPAIDEAFGGAGPEHRWVTGVSSGGWSSLWLQVNYPDDFAGCWSHVPDPVELHHFQTVDIYADGANMYVDEAGEERPIARRDGRITLTARGFVARETVLGPGGQIAAFEAVWSPRGADGDPLQLFDRETGVIDPAVAEAWKAFDIRLLVEDRWSEIGPRLGGKVRVYGGEIDTFFLEGAIPPLAEAFEALGSDAVVEIIPGMTHSLHRPGFDDMLSTMAERWSESRATAP